MNHPYLYPDEAPWTEEYRELRTIWHDHHAVSRQDEDTTNNNIEED